MRPTTILSLLRMRYPILSHYKIDGTEWRSARKALARNRRKISNRQPLVLAVYDSMNLRFRLMISVPLYGNL